MTHWIVLKNTTRQHRSQKLPATENGLRKRVIQQCVVRYGKICRTHGITRFHKVIAPGLHITEFGDQEFGVHSGRKGSRRLRPLAERSGQPGRDSRLCRL